MKKHGLKKPAKTKASYKKAEPVVEATQEDGSLKKGQEESKTLTEQERQELTGLEDTIRGSQKQFIAVGSALHTIHEKRLYKEFGDFDAYCDEKWGFSGSHARRLMDSYRVVKTLRAATPPIGEDLLPRNEYQTRMLHDSGEESSWVEKWNEVLEAAEEKSTAITGTLVKETLTPEKGKSSSAKGKSQSEAVHKVLKLIEKEKEKIDSIEAAKELLTKIEKALKKVTE